jgi:hypothetical protein
MERIGRAMVLCVAIATASCAGAGASQPAATSTGAVPGGFDAGKPAEWKLGHWVSGDGMVGLVLDRTGERPKVRVDGTADIVELTPAEDRFGGELRGYHLKSPDGTNVMYLSVSGGLTYYRGRDELGLRRDTDAAPLGAATVAGTPKPQKLPYEELLEQLAAASVRARQPKLRSEDAGDLGKVAEALATAEAPMFVRYVAAEGRSVHWAPAPETIGGTTYAGLTGYYPSEDTWDRSKGGLMRHGGVLRGESAPGSRGNHIKLLQPKGYPAPLASLTPGVVWEVDSTTVVFVTLDGGRYKISVSHDDMQKGAPFAPGLAPPAQWPEPLQHTLLEPDQIKYLAKAGSLPQKSHDELEAIDQAWNECAQKAWAGAKKEIEAIDVSATNWSTKEARKKALDDKWRAKVDKACGAHVAKMEAALLALIDARIKERAALFEKAKARAAAVGAPR